ncbi:MULTISPECIES: hypothetical protein [Nocardia]|uniref:hypothetical protein n=1 Tax=Nocardia TaxID=1817 RepID=UPI0024568466|nr:MULTISPECIES: hypothetical protein [Nocardia]
MIVYDTSPYEPYDPDTDLPPYDGPRVDEYCHCANCRSGGAYEDEHGEVPANCKFRDHQRCQGCDYYGPITNTDRLCEPCHSRYLDDMAKAKTATAS